MQDCIFCQIVAGKAPSYKVYEDEKFYGLLDIYPYSKGHVLLIPKKHYDWVHDVPNFGEYWETALKIAKAIQKGLNPVWVQYFTYGLIPHSHIHIIPRYDSIKDMVPIPRKITPPAKEEMEEIAKKIKLSL